MIRKRVFDEIEFYSDTPTTVILRPISDISLQHKAGSVGNNAECDGKSSTGYNMLNEIENDGDTTVIGHHGIDENDTVTELTSVFRLTNINLNNKIKIGSINLIISSRNDQKPGVADIYATIYINNVKGKETYFASDGKAHSSYITNNDSYEWSSYASYNKFYADQDMEIKLEIKTLVASSDRKNRMDLNITQAYVELQYFEKLN